MHKRNYAAILGAVGALAIVLAAVAAFAGKIDGMLKA